MAKVVIDAGHGGYDSGAVYNGRREKDDNLNIALAVGEYLKEKGVDVVFTRTEDVYDSPARKAQIANASGADLFVSIHRNSSPEPDTYSGVETLIFDENGIKPELAQNINESLERVGFTNLGTDIRPNLTVLRRTQMPAALVEVGFINTENDNRVIDDNFENTAAAIGDGILKTLGYNIGGVPEEGTPRYLVQVGLFKNYRYASDLALQLRALGFDVNITDVDGLYAVRVEAGNTLSEGTDVVDELSALGYDTLLVLV